LVLSGSANLLLVQQVSGGLAARAAYVGLRPLTLGEVHHLEPWAVLAQALAGDWPEEGELPARMPDGAPILLRGHLPALFPRGPREVSLGDAEPLRLFLRGHALASGGRCCGEPVVALPWRLLTGWAS